MKKEVKKEGISEKQIGKQLTKFNNVSNKIEYLESIKSEMIKSEPEAQRAYYETLANLYLKKEDLESAAKYFYKAGVEDKAKLLWKRIGDVQKIYHEKDKARKNYNKAGAFEREMELLKEKQVHSLEDRFLLVLAIGSFLCSFIFLSGSVTGYTILGANFKTSNLVGALLFIASVIAAFFYSERRK